MKKTTFNRESIAPACCSRRQKIFGIIALGGLFACGLMVGIATQHTPRDEKISVDLSNYDCERISDKIKEITISGSQDDAKKLYQLNELYTVQCAGRQNVKSVNEPDKETCEVIEELLTYAIVDEHTVNVTAHKVNIMTYQKLIEHGCPENADKYRTLIEREQNIINALNQDDVPSDEPTCQNIENLLFANIPHGDNGADSHIARAKVYANLSERGCPENSQKYVSLAAQELEIARALEDDRFDENETIEVVETYKRLRMKQAATEVINKVQQITDPAIDFILKLEQIINE